MELEVVIRRIIVTYFRCAGEFRYHGDSNPFFFRVGRDDDDYVYVQGFYGGGNSTCLDYEGTGFTVTDRQYYKNGTECKLLRWWYRK